MSVFELDLKPREKLILSLLAITLVGLLIRIFPIRMGFHYWDEAVYLQHAEILSGLRPDFYNELDFRPPLFSLILGTLYLFRPSTTAAHIVVAVLSSLVIPVTYLTSKELFNYKTGLLSALIVTISPLGIEMSHHMLVDAFLATLWISTFYVGLKSFQNEGNIYYMALTGILAALSVLTKFTSLVILPMLFLLALLYRDEKGRISRLKALFTDRMYWFGAFVFLLAMMPYLLWNYMRFGDPLSAFKMAFQLSGSADSFWVYIRNLDQLLPLPIMAFAVLSIRDLSDKRSLSLILPILMLYLPLQFVISNREIRYLLPVAPFLAIMSARGIEKLTDRLEINGGYLAVIIVMVGLFVSGSSMIPGANLSEGLYVDTGEPDVMEASQWLRSNSKNDSIVYTNYRYPALAYYSERDVELISNSESVEQSLINTSKPSGYLYYTNNSPYESPRQSYLEESPAFTKERSFGEITLYYYNSSNSN